MSRISQGKCEFSCPLGQKSNFCVIASIQTQISLTLTNVNIIQKHLTFKTESRDGLGSCSSEDVVRAVSLHRSVPSVHVLVLLIGSLRGDGKRATHIFCQVSNSSPKDFLPQHTYGNGLPEACVHLLDQPLSLEAWGLQLGECAHPYGQEVGHCDRQFSRVGSGSRVSEKNRG